MSEEFPVETDLRQGDALSPILFNIALESEVKKVQKDSIGLIIRGQNILIVEQYVDYLIIMGETED